MAAKTLAPVEVPENVPSSLASHEPVRLGDLIVLKSLRVEKLFHHAKVSEPEASRLMDKHPTINENSASKSWAKEGNDDSSP
jgi:hypothetical protein